MVINLIFVIVGTQKFQLNRLIKSLDELVDKGKLKMPIVAQIGHSDYKPKNYEFYRFLEKSEFVKYISDADVVITQGGVNSIMTVLSYNKPIIIYPRLAKYGEHVDNHQREFAEALEKNGYALCCDDGDNLEEVIKKCDTTVFKKYVSCTGNITKIINNYLDSNFG
ncbi:MAG: glycosyl transferase [Oscillospiraceae bacterium]|nr:glycosyl transferase [Oscillospiraceae bacterium]